MFATILKWVGWSVDRDEQIESVTRFLLAAGLLNLLVIILFGLFRGDATFVVWGLIGAFGAFLFGSVFGMLFGLPTAQRVTVSASNESGGANSTGPSTGYTDSTSLEQIAVWLTGIIVGLSLVNFDKWQDKFNTVATNLTLALSPSDLAVTNSAPGGFILGGFALLGFLLSYLWMRRYFIRAMVRGTITAQGDIAAADGRRREAAARLGQALAEGNVAKGATNLPDALALQNQLKAASDVADIVVAQADDVVREKAERIKSLAQNPQDQEDPWRGAFGGVASADGCVLSATISALEFEPDYFQIDLAVTVVTDSRRATLIGQNATFYLHPTFGSDPRVVPFNAAGVAALQLFSWGAFTVGVLIDDGTMLELNLADQPGATDKFRAR